MSETPQSDLARFDKGSPDGVRALYERHARAVYAHCLRRTGDWAAAEDLASGVFIQLVREPKRVRFYEGSALPWLLQTANYLHQNARRARASELRRRPPVAREEPDFSTEADARLETLTRLRQARDLFRRLAPPEQDVFALCAWSELTYEQAAFALGIPIGTVRSRLSRARAKLDALIDADDTATAKLNLSTGKVVRHES